MVRNLLFIISRLNTQIKDLFKKGFIKMDSNKKIFEVKKTFGLSVLLKLTRKTIDGIVISEMDGKYRSNLNLDEMNRAVTRTMASHNIQLKIG